MLTVADELAWDALPEETRALARRVLGAHIEQREEMEEKIERYERELEGRDNRDVHAIDELKRIEEAVANARTLVNAAFGDVNTMLRGMQARFAL